MANNLNDAINAVEKLNDGEFLELMVRLHRRNTRIINGLEEKRKSLLDEYKRLIVDPSAKGGAERDELILG